MLKNDSHVLSYFYKIRLCLIHFSSAAAFTLYSRKNFRIEARHYYLLRLAWYLLKCKRIDHKYTVTCTAGIAVGTFIQTSSTIAHIGCTSCRSKADIRPIPCSPGFSALHKTRNIHQSVQIVGYVGEYLLEVERGLWEVCAMWMMTLASVEGRSMH